MSTSAPRTVRQNLLLPGQERWPLDPDKPVIELADVHITFGDKPLFRGLNLRITPGITTVIIGRSGSGKSVLLKLMMGIQKPHRGTVTVFGRDLSRVTPVELLALRKRMSMLFQNYALFDSMTVEDNVGFPLFENSTVKPKEVLRLSHELIDTLELTGSEKLLPAELSGGMKKRVSLGRALVSAPEVVLFDEPTTGLDPIMIEKVDEMILRARQQYEITSVIISHDMASTRRLADRVAFLSDGAIVFAGTYDEFIASPVEPVRKFIEGAQTSRLERLEPGANAATVAAPQSPAEGIAAAPAVELIDVVKSFGGKVVLRGVNLPIYPNRITVLIGASGSGKSVIIKHILGLFRPDSGVIKVFGEDIGKLDGGGLQRVRTKIGLLFQHAALLDWLSVAGNVAFPLEEHGGMSRKEIKQAVEEILVRTHIADIADRMPGEISVGQRKRAGLARAIVTRPKIMIYDEPTTGQDPIRTRDIDDMIQETQEEFDITSIVISHDMASTSASPIASRSCTRGASRRTGRPRRCARRRTRTCSTSSTRARWTRGRRRPAPAPRGAAGVATGRYLVHTASTLLPSGSKRNAA